MWTQEASSINVTHGHGQVAVNVCDKEALSWDSSHYLYTVSSQFMSDIVKLRP